MTGQLHLFRGSWYSGIGTLSARSDDALTVGERMRTIRRLSAAFCLALLAGAVACRKETEGKEVAAVPQDTMLLRDLAEANRNTAQAAAVDNSLNTVRTSGDGLPAMTDASGQNRPANTRAGTTPPGGSAILTSEPRLTVPSKASDASGPTTVPLDRSPASGSRSSSGDPCDSPEPVDQRSCLNRSIVANDADLNQTYQELIAQSRKSGGADLEERFRQSQREWINQRDADCTSQGTGKLWARARARCLAAYSDKRTAELQRNLSSLRGQ
jgi:uncharacterized protein YecT (DUF1311 family)